MGLLTPKQFHDTLRLIKSLEVHLVALHWNSQYIGQSTKGGHHYLEKSRPIRDRRKFRSAQITGIWYVLKNNTFHKYLWTRLYLLYIGQEHHIKLNLS